MSQSAPFPTRAHAAQEKYALQAAHSLRTQSREDRRLAERIEHALCATGYGALRDVEVSVTASIVILIGRVPSYYLKQLAQATAQADPEAHQIYNDLDVVKSN